jgi:LysM repeat protein
MQLFEYRISPDDSKIHDSRAGRGALRPQDYSQGVLLPGLPFYLEQPGRTHDRTALASLLSRERIRDRCLVGQTDFSGGDSFLADGSSCDRSWIALVFSGSARFPDFARNPDHILPAMKWLFVLLLALMIFGGAAWFGYNTFVKEEIAVKKEQRGEVTPAPVPDISLPEFQAAAQLRQDGKLTEARDALIALIQKYPTGKHVEEAKDLLGEANVAILLSRYPSPEKTEYVVKSGDVLAKIARKLKTTPELIMRMNNMSGTMLRIGDHLLISHPDFSMVIQRKANSVVLLNHGAFFKQYHVREAKLPGKQPSKISAKVAETMAWKDGKRVGVGSREYLSSTRWIRLAGASAYTLYSVPDSAHPNLDQPPPPVGLGLAASDLEELSSLVKNGIAVTITD